MDFKLDSKITNPIYPRNIHLVHTIDEEERSDFLKAASSLNYYLLMKSKNFYDKKVLDVTEPILKEIEDLKNLMQFIERFSATKQTIGDFLELRDFQTSQEMKTFINLVSKIKAATYIPYINKY